MFVEQLSWAWRRHRASTSVDSVMRFAPAGLVLGAGTVLIASAGRDTAFGPSDMRLVALLAVAHWRRPVEMSLTHLRRAAEHWREGRDALAEAHLAMSRLSRLERPEADAGCLFVADEMMKHGFTPRDIVEAVEMDSANGGGLRRSDSPTGWRWPAWTRQPSGQSASDSGLKANVNSHSTAQTVGAPANDN